MGSSREIIAVITLQVCYCSDPVLSHSINSVAPGINSVLGASPVSLSDSVVSAVSLRTSYTFHTLSAELTIRMVWYYTILLVVKKAVKKLKSTHFALNNLLLVLFSSRFVSQSVSQCVYLSIQSHNCKGSWVWLLQTVIPSFLPPFTLVFCHVVNPFTRFVFWDCQKSAEHHQTTPTTTPTCNCTLCTLFLSFISSNCDLISS